MIENGLGVAGSCWCLELTSTVWDFKFRTFFSIYLLRAHFGGTFLLSVLLEASPGLQSWGANSSDTCKSSPKLCSNLPRDLAPSGPPVSQKPLLLPFSLQNGLCPLMPPDTEKPVISREHLSLPSISVKVLLILQSPAQMLCFLWSLTQLEVTAPPLYRP